MLNKEIVREMLVQGYTLQQVADKFGTTRQWVHQFKKIHLPELNKGTYGKSVSKQTYNRTPHPKTDLERAQRAYYSRKKENSKRGKWEFSIAFNDVIWNTHCPILGIEINWFADFRQENSPSLDRINPKEGYIPGNVVLISWRANRIKNDGSAAEHLKIAEFLNKIENKY